LNVALGAAETSTPVAPEVGVTELTFGCSGSVLKVHETGALIALPLESVAPLTTTV
jgi:hypothetical protein